MRKKKKTEKIRREFTANVSHELKTPLTTISGYAQMISNGMAKAEDIKEFGRKIEKESDRLLTLIDDIINLSILTNREVLKIRKISTFRWLRKRRYVFLKKPQKNEVFRFIIRRYRHS